ncbi:tetratricopeptide repeat protein [Robiginitomaculum antarcticum]|uniref:tetratricopeptide repeat protein n=1 Tax=Robiginitomaculum antarcticum TaxID=437507 RepID=UPI00036BD5F6|nr:tetratricopeptide repeat protein [Robiginitomaculum antarcticum]
MARNSVSTSCLGVSATLSVAFLLSACSSTQYTPAETEIAQSLTPAAYQQRTQEQREAIETQDLFAQAAFWSREYDLNPADLEAAVKLSSTLRRLGNPAQALEIAQTARAMYPRDVGLMAEYGANLIAMERGKEAIAPLSTALRSAPQNARIWSLLGAAHDQMGQYDRAREHYGRALALSPNDPSTMANLGLSFALQGDARTAEMWLRRAAAHPQASSGVRQNLALVLGLQGKYDEAEAIARQDLDPGAAENNVAYMRSMRSGSRSYGAMTKAGSAPTPAPQMPASQRPMPQPRPYVQPAAAPRTSYSPQTYNIPPQTAPAQNSAVMRGALPVAQNPNMTQVVPSGQASSRQAMMAYQAQKSGAPAPVQSTNRYGAQGQAQVQGQGPGQGQSQGQDIVPQNPNVLARITGSIKPGTQTRPQQQGYAQTSDPRVQIQRYIPPGQAAQNAAQTQQAAPGGYPQRRPALRTRN